MRGFSPPPTPSGLRSAAFLAFADQLRGEGGGGDPAPTRPTLYPAALLACREQHDLHYLQPGRFVCPGPEGDAPFMWFFPLEVGVGSPRPGSAAALLAERFTRSRHRPFVIAGPARVWRAIINPPQAEADCQ